MTAPAVEHSTAQDQTRSEVLGLALLWLMPVIGFLMVLLGLS